jgi:hypothetical protein
MDCMVNVNGNLRTAKILSVMVTPHNGLAQVRIGEKTQNVPLAKVFYEPYDIHKLLDLLW